MIAYLLLFVASMSATLMAMPAVIRRLKAARVGQYIQSDGPKHAGKAQTPTCAGLFIVMLSILVLYPTGVLFTPAGGLVALVYVAHMCIGLSDDLSKLLYRDNNLGLKVRTKFLLQAALACAALAGMRWIMGDAMTIIHVPIGQQNVFTWDFGWLYYPFGFIVIVGASNAFNLSDGLDGLFAGLTAILCITLAFLISYLAVYDHTGFLAVYPISIAGCLLGFLWFNAYPASVFLGDSGSLSIGAALACIAILTKTELLFGLMAGVYIIETVSVICQVVYFKRTGGKRLFKMAPIHHHYELCGLHETKIVVRFWVLGLIFSIMSIFWVLV
ncbi:MAG: phospho-N-acetylmuramoyl-pentapeptide-transferase [Legionellales bacterium]|nr:phospho-N-acetylmuramoyl-pentapeptide-transferase [Legionellales bacterium]